MKKYEFRAWYKTDPGRNAPRVERFEAENDEEAIKFARERFGFKDLAALAASVWSPFNASLLEIRHVPVEFRHIEGASYAEVVAAGTKGGKIYLLDNKVTRH